MSLGLLLLLTTARLCPRTMSTMLGPHSHGHAFPFRRGGPRGPMLAEEEDLRVIRSVVMRLLSLCEGSHAVPSEEMIASVRHVCDRGLEDTDVRATLIRLLGAAAGRNDEALFGGGARGQTALWLPRPARGPFLARSQPGRDSHLCRGDREAFPRPPIASGGAPAARKVGSSALARRIDVVLFVLFAYETTRTKPGLKLPNSGPLAMADRCSMPSRSISMT